MDTVKFILWETMKVLGLALLGLVAVKAVADLKSGAAGIASGRAVKGALYAVIAALAIWGARTIGYDVAAEVYAAASRGDVLHSQYAKAYDNALRAVKVRPGSLRYWRQLMVTKIAQRQFASALDDLPAFQKLSGGELDEEDAYRFALCHYYLGEYDKAISLSRKLIAENRFYAAPYVLQGLAYTAQKKYRDAELSFLDVLQTFPDHQAAVEGLAHAYFLEGNRAGAAHVLDQTTQHAFSPESRKRFDELKALYAQ